MTITKEKAEQLSREYRSSGTNLWNKYADKRAKLISEYARSDEYPHFDSTPECKANDTWYLEHRAKLADMIATLQEECPHAGGHRTINRMKINQVPAPVHICNICGKWGIDLSV